MNNSEKSSSWWSRTLWEIGLLALGMTASILLFYPGCVSGDPSFSWNEAVRAPYPAFSNWHPPAVAYTWQLLNKLPVSFSPPYANLFIAMNLVYWIGLILVIRPWFRHKILWLAFFLYAGFFPPAFAIVSQSIKDSLMCAAMLGGYGGLLEAARTRSKLAFLFGLFCLFLSLCYRYNSIFAVIPLGLWAGFILLQHASRLKKILAGGAIIVALMAGTSALNSAITYLNAYPIQQIFSFDLLGISIRTNHSYLPDFYNNDMPGVLWNTKGRDLPGDTTSLENLQQIYAPDNNLSIYWYGDGKGLRFLGDQEEVTELGHAWLNTIIHEPLAYFKTRLALYASLVGLKRNYNSPYYCMSEDIDNPEQNTMPHYFTIMSRSILCKGIFYITLITLFMGIAQWEPSRFPAHITIIGISALMYAFSYFFIGASGDFRYLYWLIPTCLIMGINLAFISLTRKQDT